jgi:hypothetical protein
VSDGSTSLGEGEGWTSQIVPGTMLMFRSRASAWYLGR